MILFGDRVVCSTDDLVRAARCEFALLRALDTELGLVLSPDATDPVQFPLGSDERNAKTNDSALAVYAVFPHTYWSVKSVKYIWSAVVPVGTHLTSSAGLTQVRVLRSGAQGKGGWVEERVNVLEDYRKYFETTEAPKPAGIAVLTDADDTGSSAQGDYASFRACKP